MALVITVAQQKGGAGKTTLAANLAVALAMGDAKGNASRAENGRRVALLDADPQKSLARWQSLRGQRGKANIALGFAEIAGWRIGIELERVARAHDIVVIDSPPQIDTDARQAVRAADLVLVPLQPSPPDLWAAEGTLKLAASERRPARLVLNRAPAGAKLRTAIEGEIAARGLPMLAAVLGNRAAFASSFALGSSVLEAAPRSVAAAEMVALAAEIAVLAG
ncbi:MAG TPA: ParA family partition ATPase [Acetobacteraceae bacterium]|nr:ParA family partition ATPase [Acetobacteraceae bacterium]